MDLTKTVTGSEPVTATEVKNYLKIDYTTDDDLIGDMITAVREMAEEFTGRSFVAQTIVLFEPSDYEQVIVLPYPDHDSVDAVTLNGDDVLSDCAITGTKEKVIKLPFVYENIVDDNDGVSITFKTSGNCPKGVKIALLKNIAELYEKRGNSFEGAVADLTENTVALLTKYMKL